MEMKTCTKCKRELSLSQFHRYNRRGETHYAQCRDCQAEYKHKNKDKLLIAQYKRRKEKRIELSPKVKAWSKLHYALRAGKIIKPGLCSICGNTENIQGHHEDYNKPFEVIWVCQKCHAGLDKKSQKDGESICTEQYKTAN